MNRRKFIKQTGLIGSTALMPLPNLKPKPHHKYKLGLQLYSINDDMNKDTFGTLKAIKAMGYEDFEIYGFDGDKVTYYGIEPSEFKERIDEIGLTASSGHYGFAPFLDRSIDELKRFVDQCIKGAKAINTPYITWPWMAPEQRNVNYYRRMPIILNIMGKQITDAGLKFAYHNHGFEFIDHDGFNFYDLILEETDPDLVKLQLDMYWLVHSSSYTPAQMINKQAGRFVMWHIKDMDKTTRDYTELGNGSIDYVSLLPDPKKSGLEFYYIEQGGNFAVNAMQSASDSAKYLKKNLQKFL